ncbi:M48 family metalloprotease [Pseudomonas sp. MAP12]|uniref:M48 family metalloprotease n=1 Tax=Geopseudomonas aromaticivorans TaxID=2849492 RepID=A0ABS6N0C7_9GAMM|nr:M48 family metalloprotease [Pseudomonas aromaticivorans]MBV2133982.1 M48 family metalloprotease [Pseudomonas aromaticivorans]
MLVRLVLTGRALPGHTPESIRQGLQERLKLSPAQSAALLPPATRVVKSQLARADGERWLALLRQVGLEARVEALEVSSAPETVTAPAPLPTPESAVPAPMLPPVAAVAPDPLLALQALARDGLKRAPPGVGYVLQLLLVTLCCVLVPVLYSALVVGLAVALGWYLMHIHEYLGRLHNIWLLLAIYAIPALSGGILLLFMARPLFFGGQREAPPRELDLAREPQLQQVIEQLCQAIGLRPPVAVHLCNEVNASVHFQGGWSGFFSGDKVLTIGMPLVAGTTVQQLVGVLAHEFGHFAQRLGMRCSFLINRVNAWLESRAYARDPWDDRLQGWLENEDTWELLRWAGWVAQYGIALARGLLRGCFALSFRLSRALSRQMEFDADRYETLIAGSAAFRQGALRLHALAQAQAEVDRQNAHTWRERRLLRDIPEATALQVARLDAQTLQRLEQSLEEGDTRYWDSHPADLERIRHSEGLKAPGHLHDPRPAAGLFVDFTGHCQRVTRDYYAALGLDYQAEQLQDSQAILQLNDQREQALDRLYEWTGRQWRALPWLPLHLPVAEAHRQLGWQAVVDELRRLSPEISRAWEEAEAQEEQRVALGYCARMQQQGVEPRLGEHEPFVAERHLPLYRQIEAGDTPAQRQLQAAASLYRRRLELSLIQATASVREAARLLLALGRLYGDYARLREARELAERFLTLHREYADQVTDRLSQDALLRFQDLALKLLDQADAIAQTLFDGATLGGYLRLRCTRLNAQPGEPLDFFRHSGTILDSLGYAYRRALAEVASHGIDAETRQGIRGIRLLVKAEEAGR